ncbi:IS1182 family transposase [Muricauda sp. SCSIO 64092]|uniref:IS1182 family transposase n=1 Tax=Allomuricauda sp. SCSIO 64092 TaxID=2908842 RepID=UPI001FF241E2|nr:IS1182 family transposase [Muricauda sp. SCSIO 64092]UOY05796.1 IS1182 family transposase [Muricauda sp. SCSIO 64092]UOY06738.1 IS1182 family transposase [Muricauda sp. SCSIO 64092]UOY08076.1 IS1182 family transposase [Muricauda sp. SCSIO 64092]
MNYIRGASREQLTLYTTCLDDMVDRDNTVRFIDVFVDNLDLEQLGFTTISNQGRPAYNPKDLLKLYIYGYMNRMRSSRVLEKECVRNIELMWLLKNLKPDHNTISRFRQSNPKAIKRVFRESVSIAQDFNLIGAIFIAGDSTKLRARNSKKNNYNKKKIQRHLEYIDNKLDEYNEALATADGDEKKAIEKAINKHRVHQDKYQQIQMVLEQDKSCENPQISTSDPDSRHQIVRGTITEITYTAQRTVDDKHKLLIDYKLTNENDKKAMGMMLRRAKSILRTNTFTALYDKGYHTGSEFYTANCLGIKTLVAIPGIGRSSQAPDPTYNVGHFIYNKKEDTYTCPKNRELISNGNWYKARNYKFKQYKTKPCKTCPVMTSCTTSKVNGKIVQRSQYKSYIDSNKKHVANNQGLYKKRQAIVEHPFGTIKRQWGFDYIITKKGIASASADFGLTALAYNLKRMFNLGWKPKISVLKAFFKHLICFYNDQSVCFNGISVLGNPFGKPSNKLIYF